jgi:hypothetical protein
VPVEDLDGDSEGVLFVIRIFSSPSGGGDDDSLNESIFISFFHSTNELLVGYCVL